MFVQHEHTHTYTYIHPMHKVLVLTSLRFMGYGAVDELREREKRVRRVRKRGFPLKE